MIVTHARVVEGWSTLKVSTSGLHADCNILHDHFSTGTMSKIAPADINSVSIETARKLAVLVVDPMKQSGAAFRNQTLHAQLQESHTDHDSNIDTINLSEHAGT